LPIPKAAKGDDETSDEDDDEEPAWEDSDDERLTVSLASVPRLRKLRETAADDVVSGKEYTRRLRIQFERLNPTPEWAIHAKKRSWDSDEEEDSDVSSDGEDDHATDDLSAQPLAKLLKDSDALSRGTDLGPRKRRKLQPEVINIQQMKEIAGEQPVCPPLVFFFFTS
jgi:U3 small nucleolar RNA-associated protein 18